MLCRIRVCASCEGSDSIQVKLFEYFTDIPFRLNVGDTFRVNDDDDGITIQSCLWNQHGSIMEYESNERFKVAIMFDDFVEDLKSVGYQEVDD